MPEEQSVDTVPAQRVDTACEHKRRPRPVQPVLDIDRQ
jgi:hypothetical protein